MDLFEALKTRRSIRKYTSEPVSDDSIHALLDAAMHAPSAKNEQPWHFIVVRDPEIRAILAKTTPYTGMAAHAPVVIVVCGDMKCEKAPGMWPQDCAAATENLLLAARGENLGTVWCGVHPLKEREEHVRAALNLPAHIIPFNLICIGHPAQAFREEQRFREERVHRDKWQEAD
ncbi:MAG: nitroreductase family protein [Desulfovibrio sp.]|nr:nitroreductase family protein [Desulfovibrio sp.]